ncbi:hypothetical protein ACHAXT_004510 [Thalassiosira profunda]
MPKVSLPVASGRLLRRHTDADALDGKGRTRSRRRRFARSLSRFSTFASKGSAVAESVEGSEGASTAVSSVEESACSDDRIVSSTVIDIDEPIDEAGARDDNATNCNDEDCIACEEDVLSKLLDWMPCLPVHEPQTVQPESPEVPTSDIDSFMKIECILRELIPFTIDEEEDDASSPSMDTRHSEASDVKLPPPSNWVLDPLLLIATPAGQSGMQVRRIRRVSDPSYFESPQCAGYEELDSGKVLQLPINNGREGPLSSWVIDFETELFAGTALFRIRESAGWASTQSSTPAADKSGHDYFAGQNRKFQMVVRGKFKRNDVVLVDCVSGLLLDRHLATTKQTMCVDLEGLPFASEPKSGNSLVSSKEKKSRRRRGFSRTESSQYGDDSLPPKWALRAAVKVAAVFSPRMDADLDCRHPRILSPLCSTAQTAHASRTNGSGKNSVALDGKHEEPCPHGRASIVNDLERRPSKKIVSSSSTPAQQRKRFFDAAYDARVDAFGDSSDNASSRCFDTDTVYTFEFLQHLLDYNDLSLDLGKVVGKMRLGGALRGQPVRFFAGLPKQRNDNKPASASHLSMKGLDCLWSFDLWHKALLP